MIQNMISFVTFVTSNLFSTIQFLVVITYSRDLTTNFLYSLFIVKDDMKEKKVMEKNKDKSESLEAK